MERIIFVLSHHELLGFSAATVVHLHDVSAGLQSLLTSLSHGSTSGGLVFSHLHAAEREHLTVNLSIAGYATYA